MRYQRGAGIGLEITDRVVRGVRIDPDAIHRVALSTEVPIATSAASTATLEALLHARALLGLEQVPVNIAWFPPGATLHRIEITGWGEPQINASRQQLADTEGITSTIVFDTGTRRWLLALQWDHTDVHQIRDLAMQAGFSDVTIEPAPLALMRVAQPDSNILMRFADADTSWTAVIDRGAPLCAAHVPRTADVVEPDVHFSNFASAAFLCEGLATPAELGAALQQLTSETVGERDSPSQLSVVDALYPLLEADDPAAGERIAVAFGAAIGAAGLAGTARALSIATPSRNSVRSAWRPWTLEALAEPIVEPPRPTLWQRLVVHCRSVINRLRR